MPTKPMDQIVRIQRNVTIDEAGCWNWNLHRDRVGYGRLKVSLGSRTNIRWSSAHRYAYELFVGEIPQGLHVLHRCDNRACCNPAHLWIGTHRDNMLDMHAKGRGPKGYKRHPIARDAQNARKGEEGCDNAK